MASITFDLPDPFGPTTDEKLCKVRVRVRMGVSVSVRQRRVERRQPRWWPDL
jgi:hypothetical protein